MALEKLSALAVARAKTPGLYGDGGGLSLQVGPSGSKSWSFRFTLAGKARQMGLGAVADISLVEARDMAREARRLLRDGKDPIEERRAKLAAQRAEDGRSLTFKLAAERFIESHKAGWKSAKHADQWLATLTTYAFPTLGEISVSAVDTPLVMKAIEPIWIEKPETASRVRGRVESILSWASARGLRSGPNPAQWRNHLDRLLPPKSKVRRVKHHPAVPVADLPAFMAALRENVSSSSRALQFAVLTAARTTEIIKCTWDELDLKARVWNVPSERMKSGRPHRVPLSTEAIAVLEAVPRERGNNFVFLGGKPGKGLSNAAMLELMKGMPPFSEFVPHGCRSTFRDWVFDRTTFGRELAEQALAHVVESDTEAAYKRSDALERRRRLMQAWARFACSPPVSVASGENVVLLTGAI